MYGTDFDIRDCCRSSCELLSLQRFIAEDALRAWRCGWGVQWCAVLEYASHVRVAAELLAMAARWEVSEMNHELQLLEPGTELHFKEPKKPRWAKRNAPPCPARLRASEVEPMLEGLLEWIDTVIDSADAPKGACYPQMPESMQAVLGRNGFDPHHHRSPDRMIRKYLCW